MDNNNYELFEVQLTALNAAAARMSTAIEQVDRSLMQMCSLNRDIVVLLSTIARMAMKESGEIEPPSFCD